MNRAWTTLRARSLGTLLGLALLSACTSEPLPDVLLVTFDTTRYDRFYGFSADVTLYIGAELRKPLGLGIRRVICKGPFY